jgi:hypothetical protein
VVAAVASIINPNPSQGLTLNHIGGLVSRARRLLANQPLNAIECWRLEILACRAGGHYVIAAVPMDTTAADDEEPSRPQGRGCPGLPSTLHVVELSVTVSEPVNTRRPVSALASTTGWKAAKRMKFGNHRKA